MPDTKRTARSRHSIFLLLCMLPMLLLGISLSLFHYQQLDKLIRTDGDALFQRIVDQVSGELENIYHPPMQALNIMALSKLVTTTNLSERLDYLPMMAQVLSDNVQLNSVYIGWQGGDYLMLRPLGNRLSLQRFSAPRQARWMAWHIGSSATTRQNSYLFLNENLQIIEARMAPDEGYDPRERPWYAAASAANQRLITTPYLFFSTREFGTTLARASNDLAVLGADLTLDRLSEALRQQRMTPSSELILYTSDGVVVAYQDPNRLLHTTQGSNSLEPRRFNELGSTLLATLAQDGYEQERQTIKELEGQRWVIQQQRINILGTPDVYLAVLIPEAELLSEAYRLRTLGLWLSLAISLLLLPLSWLLWRRLLGLQQADR